VTHGTAVLSHGGQQENEKPDMAIGDASTLQFTMMTMLDEEITAAEYKLRQSFETSSGILTVLMPNRATLSCIADWRTTLHSLRLVT
jgi:hypothetical protein